MVSTVFTATVIGLDANLVEVETDISASLSAFIIVGLPDKSVDEAKERVRSAIKNSGLPFPRTKVTVNLAPADCKKVGSGFDLPMALGILLAEKHIPTTVESSVFVGELSLDGTLRHTQGILPIAIFARSKGYKTLFVPAVNAPEAALVDGIEIIPVQTLTDLVTHLEKIKIIAPYKRLPLKKGSPVFDVDFAYIAGQENAKRALEIAAAGGHNILLSGPPGSGKTLLARAVPSILPQMSETEILEVTKIYSVAGLLPKDTPLIFERPFRTPHHTSSNVALVGGGTNPRPGEISLAHRGVLFLDEFPEFSRSVLESLRQPLEDGSVTVSRAQSTVHFPASFTLVASQNPCPCGYYSDPVRECTCSPSQIHRYQRKVSGPILDRIDIRIEVPPVKIDKLTREEQAESSEKVRARVEAARKIQEQRFKHVPIIANAEMGARDIRNFCQMNDETLQVVKQAVTQMHLSARSFHRVLKLSRTIADLDAKENIETTHVTEALQYRPRSTGGI